MPRFETIIDTMYLKQTLKAKGKGKQAFYLLLQRRRKQPLPIAVQNQKDGQAKLDIKMLQGSANQKQVKQIYFLSSNTI